MFYGEKNYIKIINVFLLREDSTDQFNNMFENRKFKPRIFLQINLPKQTIYSNQLRSYREDSYSH